MENDTFEETVKNNYNYVVIKAKTYYLEEDEKIKDINYANNRNENISGADKERRKEYTKNYYY